MTDNLVFSIFLTICHLCSLASILVVKVWGSSWWLHVLWRQFWPFYRMFPSL